MELWDVLDSDGRKTGETVERGKPMRPGTFHLVVDVWVKNRNGKYLISKRAPNKPFPGMWETTGGAALSGEDGLTAAVREVKEEVGLDLTGSGGKIIHLGLRPDSIFPSILEVWHFNENVFDVETNCQIEEVSEARWADKAEILELIRNKLFLNHLSPRLSELE